MESQNSIEGGPCVSVVIPSYNMDGYVCEAIDSVLQGDFKSVEVVVVDDGSTDNTREVLQQYINPEGARYDPRVRYERQENKGKSEAVNRGLREARGEYITILDADDKLTPESIVDRIRGIEGADAKGGEVLVVGGFKVFKNGEEVVGKRSIPYAVDIDEVRKRFYASYKTPFHMNACLVSRGLIDRVGMFDGSLRRCQDIDYSLRMLSCADDVVWVPNAVYMYRKHRSSWVDRVMLRAKTIYYRPIVFWKNYRRGERWVAILCGVMWDLGKMVYEVVGSYTK